MSYTQHDIKFIISFIRNKGCSKNEVIRYGIVCTIDCPLYQLNNPSCKVIPLLERAQSILNLYSEEEIFEAIL